VGPEQHEHRKSTLEIAAARRGLARNRLKLTLVISDALTILLGFFVVLWFSTFGQTYGLGRVVLVSVFAAAAGSWATRAQGLLLARVSSIRVVETTRIARAMVMVCAVVLLFDRVVKTDVHIRVTVLACLVCVVALCATRAVYRSWLADARTRGAHLRRVAIIGVDEEAVRIDNLLRTHTEIGMTVVGVIGDRDVAVEHCLGERWLGEADDAEAIAERLDVSGVVIGPNGVTSTRLNVLVRNMHAAGRHVHLGTGIAGMDARRLRALPLAYEPLFYVEPPLLSRVQIAIKRCFDVVLASLAIIFFSPVLIIAALAVKLGDGGPVIYKQTRVGRYGRTFALYKFRSMQVGADKRLAELQRTNERNGPLFKMERDPRVTRIGKFLRDSSLDELPQLLNVIRGDMSLVGPRPALPAEVLAFPPELRVRENVRPGITGLWQMECRDSPSFEAYRRLDLFYVENWSLTLDLVIIMGTMEHMGRRVVRMMLPAPAVAPAEAEPGVAEA